MPWKEMTLLQGKSTISSAVNKLLRSLFSCLESAAPLPIQETGLNLSYALLEFFQNFLSTLLRQLEQKAFRRFNVMSSNE